MLKKQSSPHFVSRIGRVVLKRGMICPKRRSLRVALLLTAFALPCSLTTLHAADTGATPVQDAGRLFAPLAYPDAPNVYRSGSGRRGPQAWQNRADYDIRVTIDPTNRTLSGSEIITYTNNSPDALDALWVQLDQNIYREGSRADFVNPERHEHHTDGIAIESVSIEDEGRSTPLVPVISDTRMQLALADPMQKGEKRKIRIVWHYTVPGEWGGRTAVSPSRNGDIYEIAQFYPRMAVYDDIRGWDAAPYLGQEFYLEYGDFDYSVTVPSRFVVAGSGALVNPAEVLTQEQRDRLAQAAKSEQRIMIRTQAEVEGAQLPPPPSPQPEATPPAKKGATEPDKKAEPPQPATRTWHFRMANTRDVAFMASAAFLWDAAKLDLPPLSTGNEKDRQPAPRLAMSFYPVEGIGAHGWDRSTAYVKHAIEYFSSQWSPYPWPNVINAAGHGASMEYPGIAFGDAKKRDPDLFAMTTHELGHQWFPMMVGSNERRHAFMDEGFDTFIDTMAATHFNGGEFAPKRDAEYAAQTGKPAIDIVSLLRDRAAPVLMAPSDTVSETYRHDLTYFKSAYGLTLLREQILGPDRFDRALRGYIKEWSFHHPTPSDFFRFMNSETGEDLSWFWRGWYFNNWAADYAVGAVSYAGNDPRNGAIIPVINKGRLPLPVVLQVTWMDGSSARIRIPTEAWMLRSQLNVQVAGNQLVRTAILDPDKSIPDIDRSNNSFGEIPTAFPAAAGH